MIGKFTHEKPIGLLKQHPHCMFTGYKKNKRVSLVRSIASDNQWLLSPTKQMIINIGVEVENEKHLLLLGIQPGTGIMEINMEVP